MANQFRNYDNITILPGLGWILGSLLSILPAACIGKNLGYLDLKGIRGETVEEKEREPG